MIGVNEVYLVEKDSCSIDCTNQNSGVRFYADGNIALFINEHKLLFTTSGKVFYEEKEIGENEELFKKVKNFFNCLKQG
ncbi:hypothetical protein KGF47_18210 [Clostridioides sp. ZZV13-5731]|uniref:hypothetical protein n=1 Tax=Clostridioides sp. ZZV13-5731 TaxID=2811485 RepID=UPI001D1014FD|nr:hypothetical protein [Clostridioides sp. ZZV13-5731]